jgi:hypothetical protein
VREAILLYDPGCAGSSRSVGVSAPRLIEQPHSATAIQDTLRASRNGNR